MDEILNIINTDKHPLIQIILVASEIGKMCDISNWKLQLEKQQQTQIENRYRETHNIHDSLESILQHMSWDPIYFDQSYLTLNNFPEIIISLQCMYQMVCYLATNTGPIDENLFLKFLQVLLRTSNISDNLVSFFFNELIKQYIHQKVAIISSEKMIIMNKLFYILHDSNEYLANSFFLLLKKIFSFSDQATKQQALDLLVMALLNNKTYLRPDDFNKVIAIIDPFLKAMNLRSIQALCLISTKCVSQSIKDNFTMLASILVTSFLGEEPIFKFCMFKNNNNIVYKISPIFEFHCAGEHEFETKLHYLPQCVKTTQIPSDITSNINYNRMYELADALEKADTLCLDSFLMSLRKIISSFEKNDHWFDMLGFIFILLNRIVSLTSLLPYENLLTHNSIFHPSQNIFNSKIDPKVNFVRNYSVRILSINAPSLLSNLIVSQSEYPLIAIETIIRILQLDNQIDLRIFTTEKCLSALSFIVDSSWELFKQAKYTNSFHSIFGFIMDLANETITSQYLFEHSTLVHSLLFLLAERFLINPILEVVRVFLINSSRSYPAIASGLAIIFQKCSEKNEGKELGIEMIKTIIYVLSRAPIHAKSFEFLIDPIMNFASYNANANTLQQVLQIISLENQSISDFKLSSMKIITLTNLIRTVEGLNPSYHTMTSILNLCAKTNANTDRSLFLIRNPSFIPVSLAVFGKSEKIGSLFDIFSKLCMNSLYNIKAFHDSGFTSIIIEYVFGKVSEINYRGFVIELNLSEELITEKVYPLLERILSLKADNSVALQLMSFMKLPSNKLIVDSILNWLTSSLVENSSIQFQLNKNQPVLEIVDLPSAAFNKSFSICMWIKVDQLASISSETSVILASFKDQNNDAFKLTYFRGKAFYSFDTMREGWETQTTCLASIPPGKFTFISFVCQRYSIEKSAVGFFANNQMLFCGEVNHMMFDVSSKLKFSVGGGEINELNIVQVSNFGLSNKLIDEETLQQFSVQSNLVDTSCFYFALGNYTIKSEKSIDFSYPSQSKPITLTALIKGAYNDQSSVRYFLGIGNHLMGFVNCFDSSFSGGQSFLMKIIGIIKNVLTDSQEAQEVFKGFSLIGHLLIQNPSILTYQLYVSFFSIFEVIKNQELQIDLFDGIILNTSVWEKSSHFARIVRHWHSRVTEDCRSMFLRKGIFSTLFRQYPKLLTCVTLEEYSVTKQYLCGLLIAIGDIMFVGKDLDVIFSILGEEIDKESDLIEQYLIIIEKFSPLFSHSPKMENNLSLLLILLEKKSVNIVVSALKAIHAYTFPICVPSMIAASIQLNRSEIKHDVYSSVIPMVVKYPGLMHFCCFTALSLNETEKELCSAVIRGASDIFVSYAITNEQNWYLGALLLSIQLKDEALDHMAYFIEMFASKSNSIIEVISVILLLTGLLHIDSSKLILRIIECALSHNSISSKSVAQLGSMGVLFRFADYSIDPILLSYYERSPFFDKEIAGVFECWANSINDVLVVEQILSRDLDKFDVRFGISIESNSNAFQESPIEKLSLMNADFSGIQILKTLIEYFSHEKSNDQSSSFRFLEAVAPEIHEAQQQLSKSYKQIIIDSAESIKNCIKAAKCQIQVGCNTRVTVTSQKKKQLSLIAISSYQEYHESTLPLNLSKTPSSQYGFSYIPGFKKFLYHGLFDDYLKKSQNFSIADIGTAEKNIFSFPAIQRVFGKDHNVVVFISRDRLQIIKSSSHTQQITKDDIEFVIERKPNSIELFLKFHESIFLDFSPISSHEIIEYLLIFDERIGFEPSETIQYVFGSRKSWSNLESIIIKELFTGKSFHINGCEPVINIGKTIFLVQDLQNFSASNTVNPFNLRLEIEKEDYNQEFEPMNGGKMKPRISLKDVNVNGLGISVEEIYSYCMNETSILILANNVETTLYKFEKSSVARCKIPEFPISLGIISNLLSSSYGFMIIEKETCHITIITEDSVKHFVNVSSEVAFDGKSIISVVNGCDIWLTSAQNPNFSQHHIAYLPRNVNTVALSESIGIFAACTDRGEVIVHSLYRPEFYALIKIPREPVRILITDCFGIILVDIEDKILGFTNQGEQIGQISCLVTHWIKLRTNDAIDYVVFSDDQECIWAFSPVQMSEVRPVGSLQRHIMALSYYADASAVAALTADCCVTFIPFCF